MKSVTPRVRAADGRAARWDNHRQQRRRALLRSIRQVISRRGPDVSMETISTELAISKTILYRYFGDRAGLELAMGEWSMRTITTSLDQASKNEDSPHAALGHMIGAFVHLAAQAPNIYAFCSHSVSANGPGAVFFDTVTDLLCERMRLEDPSLRMWARGAVGFVRSCTETWLDDPDDIDAFIDRVTTWLWRSVPLSDSSEETTTLRKV